MAPMQVFGEIVSPIPDILTVERCDHNKQIQLRPGNWVARELRQFNMDSIGHVVPDSAYSKRSYKKYNSLYDVDFSDITNKTMREFLNERMIDGAERRTMERARETVADVFGGRKNYDTLETFAKWKIPSRLLEETSQQHTDTPRAFTAASVRQRHHPPSQNCLVPNPDSICVSPTRSKTTFPVIKAHKKAPGSRHSIVSHSSDGLLRDELQCARRCTSVSRPQTVDGGLHSRSLDAAYPEKLERSNTIIGTEKNISGSYRRTPKDAVKQTIIPEMCDKVDEWMQRAPNVKRGIIANMLTMAGKTTELEHSIKRTLLPDAQKDVRKWLETANDDERKVALQFFTSMAETGLMKHTENEKRLRIQGVIKALERLRLFSTTCLITEDHNLTPAARRRANREFSLPTPLRQKDRPFVFFACFRRKHATRAG